MADALQREQAAFDPETSEKTFSLLLSDVGMVRFLPPLIAHLAQAAPYIKVRALPLDSRHFELKLESGEADLALGAFSEGGQPSALPAAVFRRLRERCAEGAPARRSRTHAEGLSRRATS